MSIEAMTWVWDLNLPSSQKFVLLAIANYADQEGSCYPGQERLCRMTGSSPATVRRSLKSLESAGAFTRERRTARSGSGRTSDRYYLNLAWRPVEANKPPEYGAGVSANNFNPSDCEVESDRGFNPSPCTVESGFNPSNCTVSTRHHDGGTIREPLGIYEPKESEPDDSDAVIEEKPSSREDVEELIDLLDTEIEANGNRLPKRNKTNRNAMRLLLDRDKATSEQVAYVIRWSQHNQFWKANILSASKLREKFPQLVAKIKAEAERPKYGYINKADLKQQSQLTILDNLSAYENEQNRRMLQ